MIINSINVLFSDNTHAFVCPRIEVFPGSIYWLRGQNGSGKTTLLNNILRYSVDGAHPQLLDQNYRRYIFEYHPVWWNVSLPLLTRGTSARSSKEAAIELLQTFQLKLSADRYAANLSGGEQHIILILRVMLTKPRLLLLDEPTAGLDGEKLKIFWDVVSELIKTGCIVLLVSHDVPPFSTSSKVADFDGVRGKRLSMHLLEKNNE